MEENIGDILIEVVSEAKLKLHRITNDDSEIRPTPDSWSNKEVIGHLVDSAIINDQRFMRAQFQDDLVFHGYDQEEWVRLQNYNSVNWTELLNLWYSLNIHISNIMKVIPEDKILKEHEKHSLGEIGWKFPVNGKATLQYFMKDYIMHLEHHLSQIIKGYKPVVEFE